jgi:prepilin-type N-terminal cleavage/methylation domain-containing protein
MNRKFNESRKGFSLLELLIVVGVILVIATIAIPSLLKSRQVSNENAAVANLRTISNAEAGYLSASGGYYGGATDLVNHQLLDDRFVGKSVSGYTYSISGDQFSYTAVATPVSANMGRWEYYMVVDGVIRYSTTLTLAPVGQSGNSVH